MTTEAKTLDYLLDDLAELTELPILSDDEGENPKRIEDMRQKLLEYVTADSMDDVNAIGNSIRNNLCEFPSYRIKLFEPIDSKERLAHVFITSHYTDYEAYVGTVPAHLLNETALNFLSVNNFIPI